MQTHECLLDGENVSLTPTEFSILNVLLENAGTVVSIEYLFHAVWKEEYYSKIAALSQCISDICVKN